MLPATFALGCCCEPCTPPTLETPANVTVCEGDPATLGPAVAAGTAPLLFQWYRGASGDTTNPIAGATGATLTIPAATPADAGSYWVQVQNPCGLANSGTVTLIVDLAPVAGITPPPPGPYIGPVLLTVNTLGPGPFSFAWQSGPAAVGPFAPIPGEILPTYLAPGDPLNPFVTCIVSNPCGDFTCPPVQVDNNPPPA